MLIMTASAGGNPIEVGSEWTSVGRGESNQVNIADGSVSSRHGEVKSEGDLLHVRDLNSSNGTFVNGNRVTQATLRPGDALRLGQVALVWRPPAATQDSLPAIMADIPVPVPLPVANGCRNHPMVVSPWTCPKCQERWCADCVTKPNVSALKGKVFCPACKSICQPLHSNVPGSTNSTPVPVPLSSRKFSQMIGHSFAYPFRPLNIAAIIAAAFFFTGGAFVLRHTFVMGLTIGILGLGLLVSFFVKVIQTSAQGEGELPAWSDLSDITNEIRVPAFQFIGTTILLYTPVILAWILVNLDGPYRALLEYFETGELSFLQSMVLLIAYGVTIVVKPAVYLAVAMHEEVSVVFNPASWWRAMTQAKKDYAILVALYVLFDFVLISGSRFVLGLMPIPVLTPVLEWFVWLCLTTVEFRLVGLFYYANRQKIGWF